jgi:hypothetical protein
MTYSGHVAAPQTGHWTSSFPPIPGGIRTLDIAASGAYGNGDEMGFACTG